ncbi:MAG: hypothetical protein ACR2NB_08755 [Solirubrobacteraceae bacterium]
MAPHWSTVEDARLRRLYATGAPVAAIASQLGRSGDAVVARRELLGIAPRRVPRPWSGLEDQLLRSALEARVPGGALATRLGRSVDQVSARRRQLGLQTPAARRYSPAEDVLLREQWAAGRRVDELAHRLRRSPDAVRVHADALGLHRPARRHRWSAAEDAALRDGYADGRTCQHIANSLSGRTARAVAARARKLGLTTYARGWTGTDDARLRELAARGSPAEIARALGRTPEAVRRRARALRLTLQPRSSAARTGARWSPNEDALLRLHAGLNPAALAAHLGRSDQAVVARLRRLGLRDGRRRSPHHPAPTTGGLTPGEWRLVDRELRRTSGRGLLALGRRLERSPGALRKLVGDRTGVTRPSG